MLLYGPGSEHIRSISDLIRFKYAWMKENDTTKMRRCYVSKDGWNSICSELVNKNIADGFIFCEDHIRILGLELRSSPQDEHS